MRRERSPTSAPTCQPLVTSGMRLVSATSNVPPTGATRPDGARPAYIVWVTYGESSPASRHHAPRSVAALSTGLVFHEETAFTKSTLPRTDGRRYEDRWPGSIETQLFRTAAPRFNPLTVASPTSPNPDACCARADHATAPGSCAVAG